MNRCSVIAWYIAMAAVAMLVAMPAVAAKKVKEKPRQGQAGHNFVNHESVEAYGLVVQLSKKAIVVTDPNTGFAGPFQNIRSNGSTSITLSHARPVVIPSVAEDDGFDLIFRSYKSGLKIKSYWWIDAQGKRIGKKHSP
jgi:hypothetical protein